MILTTNAAASVTATTVTPAIKAFPKKITGPSTIDSGTDAVYKVTEYTKNESDYTGTQLTEFKADKDNIRWAIWVEGTFMANERDYAIVENRTLITEPTDDLYEEQNKEKFINLVSTQGYLEATIETLIESGQTINRLTIKYSKWLDGKKVYIEAFRNNPDHNTAKDYVKTCTVKATTPEILKIFWHDPANNEITTHGYNVTLDLLIYSLGLKTENLDLTLFDFDTNLADSDPIVWETGVTVKTVQITDRYTHVEYIVPTASSPLYAAALADDTPIGDQTLELFVKVASTNTNLILEDKYADLLLTDSSSIKDAFIGESVAVTNPDRFIYNKFDYHYLGGTVKIIAEFANMNGQQVTFSLYEVTALLTTSGAKLSVLYNNTAMTDIPATVTNGYAIAEIKFHTLNDTTYNAWLALLEPGGTNPNTESEIKVEVKKPDNTTQQFQSGFKLRPPTVVQKIYHDGFLSLENYVQDVVRKVNLVYVDAIPTEHNLGTFDVTWAQRWVVGSSTNHAGWKKEGTGDDARYYQYDGAVGVKKSPLISIFSGTATNKVFDYNQNGLDFRISETTSREYFNPERIAAIIGAVIDSGYDDVVTNGSVSTDGRGWPSVSHVNGNNVDFKYLRTDQNRPEFDNNAERILVTDALLDVSRQNTLLDAFYKFGFAREGKNLSHYIDATAQTLLNHCEKKAKHKNHLHIQRFRARYK